MPTIVADSTEETRRVGELIGQHAHAGTIVALVGDLGAGKTVLAKGIGAGLQVPSRVVSPTFVLVQAHEGGRLPLWHADLYRLGDADEIEQIGLVELAESGGVTVVEWADRFPEVLPADHLRVVFTDLDIDRRQLLVEATGPRHRHLEVVVGG